MSDLRVMTADEQVAAILAADARRVRRLTRVTVGLWGLTVLLTGLLLGGFYHHHRYAANAADAYRADRLSPTADQQKADRVALSRVVMLNSYLHVGTGLLAVAVGLLALSALGTVLLVHASRRATLRQIQASLAAISAQLTDLQRTRGTPPAGS